MSFKDQMQKDLTAILNTNEFGEEIEFMGNQCLAVVEYGGTTFLEAGDQREGVALETVSLHLKREAVPAILTPDLALSFEGSIWHVHSSVPAMGMLTVNLYRELAA